MALVSSESIAQGYRRQAERIAQAAQAAGRDPREITLELAVKYQSVANIQAALAAGGRLMGHNLAQQLRESVPALISQLPNTGISENAIDVHFIGHLQSNKINQVLPWISTVESVDSLRLARRLSQAVNRLRERFLADDAGAGGGGTSGAGERLYAAYSPIAAVDQPLDLYLQVNTSGEESKFGVAPEAALDLAGEIAALDNVHLAGWMTIGAHVTDEAVIARSFADLRELRERAHAQGVLTADQGQELSMGMTADLPIAIAEGATIVRIGTAIFGPRPAK